MLQNYRHVLDCKLENLDVPWESLKCVKLNCACFNHSSNILSFYKSVINSCLDAALETLPNASKCPKAKPIVPGSNDFVKDAKRVWQEYSYNIIKKQALHLPSM